MNSVSVLYWKEERTSHVYV